MSLTAAAMALPWPVFACGADKRPIVATGFKAATRDPEAIRAMFDKPGAAMIGVPTGAVSGIIVVDIDNKENRQGGQWLQANSHRMPQTRTIRTKSGGLHIYLKHPGFQVRNSNDRIAPGIDVRGDGGYVIAPPSPGYREADNAPIANVPEWLIPILIPPPDKPYEAPRYTGLNSPYGLAALRAECEAIRCAGFGNQEFTLNAASLKIGALIAGGELDASSWHSLIAAGRDMPSQPGSDRWSPREIEEKVRRGVQDGMAHPRSAPPPELPPYVAPEPTEVDKLLWTITKGWNEKDIPPRPWIAKGYLLRSAVTVLSGPGSAGKSSLMVVWSACIALGCSFGNFQVTEKLRVMTYNTEDDEHEQKRRYSAVFRSWNKSHQDWEGNLIMVGPKGVGTLLTTTPGGQILVNTAVMDKLETLVREFRPDVLMLDPFVELHDQEENDNTAIRGVIARFRSMAMEHEMSVVLLHHSRKGAATPGDPDSMRGASSIVGAARVALTINVMTEEEALALGVGTDTRRNYFRLDGAKSNYAPIGDAEWFQRASYGLTNGDTVASIEPWKPPSHAPSGDVITAAINGIAMGYDSAPWSPRISDEPRSFRHLATRLGVTSHIAQKTLLDTLMKAHGVAIGDCCRGKGKAKSDTMKGLKTSDGAPHTVEWQ